MRFVDGAAKRTGDNEDWMENGFTTEAPARSNVVVALDENLIFMESIIEFSLRRLWVRGVESIY
jgi:hypothetical protein